MCLRPLLAGRGGPVERRRVVPCVLPRLESEVRQVRFFLVPSPPASRYVTCSRNRKREKDRYVVDKCLNETAARKRERRGWGGAESATPFTFGSDFSFFLFFCSTLGGTAATDEAHQNQHPLRKSRLPRYLGVLSYLLFSLARRRQPVASLEFNARSVGVYPRRRSGGTQAGGRAGVL